MPYTLTTYPNVLGHPSQMVALEVGLPTLAVLDELCYDSMQYYWCIVFAPPCVDGHIIPPCLKFCRSRCIYKLSSTFRANNIIIISRVVCILNDTLKKKTANFLIAYHAGRLFHRPIVKTYLKQSR